MTRFGKPLQLYSLSICIAITDFFYKLQVSSSALELLEGREGGIQVSSSSLDIIEGGEGGKQEYRPHQESQREGKGNGKHVDSATIGRICSPARGKGP